MARCWTLAEIAAETRGSIEKTTRVCVQNSGSEGREPFTIPKQVTILSTRRSRLRRVHTRLRASSTHMGSDYALVVIQSPVVGDAT